MKRFVWSLKQLLPFKYSTKYRDEAGVRHFTNWRMWFGVPFMVKDWTEF